MRLFDHPYKNDLVICKDSPDDLQLQQCLSTIGIKPYNFIEKLAVSGYSYPALLSYDSHIIHNYISIACLTVRFSCIIYL